MPDQVNDAVEMVLSSGHESANPDDVLRQLDAALQQDLQSQAAVLSAEEPPAWVLSGEEGGGFGSMAGRFISFYRDALRRELCDIEGGCLKQKYRDLIGSEDTKTQVRELTPTVVETLGGDAKSLSSPITIAAYVALWLARSGLEQWCAKASQDTAAGAAPAPAA